MPLAASGFGRATAWRPCRAGAKVIMIACTPHNCHMLWQGALKVNPPYSHTRHTLFCKKCGTMFTPAEHVPPAKPPPRQRMTLKEAFCGAPAPMCPLLAAANARRTAALTAPLGQAFPVELGVPPMVSGTSLGLTGTSESVLHRMVTWPASISLAKIRPSFVLLDCFECTGSRHGTASSSC
jgi:hypothetical protein